MECNTWYLNDLCAICHIVTIYSKITLTVNVGAISFIWCIRMNRWDGKFNYVGWKQGFIWIKNLFFNSWNDVVNSSGSNNTSISNCKWIFYIFLLIKTPNKNGFFYLFILNEKKKELVQTESFNENFHKFWFNYSTQHSSYTILRS